MILEDPMTFPQGPSGPSGPAPDWYPDPHDTTLNRYWDGTRWTEHTAPNPTATAFSQPPPKKSRKTMWIVLSVVGGVVIIGGIIMAVLFAAAAPVLLSQQAKAEDVAAKSDVSILAKEIAIWFVDNPAMPVVTGDGTEYTLDGEKIANQSANVEFGGTTGSNSTNWCVWVTNPNGDLKDFEYSAQDRLAQGTC